LKFRTTLVLASVALSVAGSAAAQDNVTVGGLSYLDYNYVLACPEDVEGEGCKGENGFGYRRVYLTVDYKLSDAFSGRVRFEANDRATTEAGRPSPFIKDLFLKWKWTDGHDVVLGVTNPPSFVVSEKVWAYRSLERTIQDDRDVLESRDLGLAAHGRINASGTLRYGIMLGNNSSVGREIDKAKRIYGQLEICPSKKDAKDCASAAGFIATLGADYAKLSDDVADAVNVNGFAGYRSGPFTVGVESFFNKLNLNDAAADSSSFEEIGVSLFGHLDVNETITLIGRYDHANSDLTSIRPDGRLLLAGVDIRPHKNVHFIPNVLTRWEGDSSALVTARVTLHVEF
jgi:hypothetical protein